MVRKVKRHRITRLNLSRFGGPLEAFPLAWDGNAPWFCSWCGGPLDAFSRGSVLPVSGFTNAGAFAQGLYPVRLPGREIPGLLVAGAPDGEVPLGFVTCGQECADALMAYGGPECG